MEPEKLKSKVLTEQINIWVAPELKKGFEKLKRSHRINTAAEIRKALAKLLSELEASVAA